MFTFGWINGLDLHPFVISFPLIYGPPWLINGVRFRRHSQTRSTSILAFFVLTALLAALIMFYLRLVVLINGFGVLLLMVISHLELSAVYYKANLPLAGHLFGAPPSLLSGQCLLGGWFEGVYPLISPSKLVVSHCVPGVLAAL